MKIWLSTKLGERIVFALARFSFAWLLWLLCARFLNPKVMSIYTWIHGRIWRQKIHKFSWRLHQFQNFLGWKQEYNSSLLEEIQNFKLCLLLLFIYLISGWCIFILIWVFITCARLLVFYTRMTMKPYFSVDCYLFKLTIQTLNHY